MTEIELRFQIPAGRWAAVHRWVCGEGTPPAPERLQASYFDTPARDLARAGFALRLRKEGDVWVQTLKGAAPDGMTRLEHNVPVEGDAPLLDVHRHADHPAGQTLLALLETLPGTSLQALFHTDIERFTRALSTPFGEVELALDHGALRAGEGDDERRLPVAELEIELKQGEPRAVLEVARDWALREFGLTLELRTKALRGDLLARRAPVAPVRESRVKPWRARATRGEALQALITASIEPILGNASQIVSGTHRAEHLHQLRVALRRLRTGVELLAAPEDAVLLSLAEGAHQLSGVLTAARDADAQSQAPWRHALDAAWQQAALAAPAADAAPVTPPVATDAAALLRDPVWQDWMLAMIAWLTRGPVDDTPVGEVAPRIQMLADKALHLAQRFDRLDAAGRHHLRRRLRRWKLALELCVELDPPATKHVHKRLSKDPRKALKRLQSVQQALGALNDLEVGLTHAREALVQAIARGDAHGAARAGFEHGWLTPRRDASLAQVALRIKRLKR